MESECRGILIACYITIILEVRWGRRVGRPRSFQIGFKHCELPFFDSRVSQMGTIYGVAAAGPPGRTARGAARRSNSRGRFTAPGVSDGGRTDPTLNRNGATSPALYLRFNAILSFKCSREENFHLNRSGTESRRRAGECCIDPREVARAPGARQLEVITPVRGTVHFPPMSCRCRGPHEWRQPLR